jgi:DNA-binding CsgD family transcriptional regulator
MASQASGELTRRETEIVALIAQGLNSRQIARRLNIAYFTVRKHRSNILGKLQLTSAAQLSAYAAQLVANQLPSDHASQRPGPP